VLIFLPQSLHRIICRRKKNWTDNRIANKIFFEKVKKSESIFFPFNNHNKIPKFLFNRQFCHIEILVYDFVMIRRKKEYVFRFIYLYLGKFLGASCVFNFYSFFFLFFLSKGGLGWEGFGFFYRRFMNHQL